MLCRTSKSIILFLIPFSTALSHDHNFGVGILAGEPTAATIKIWGPKQTAFEGAIGASPNYDWRLNYHFGVLFHNFKALTAENGDLGLYFGIGYRKIVGKFEGDRESRWGWRTPFGITYLPRNKSLEWFLELAPILDFAHRDIGISFNASAGVRFGFRDKRRIGP